MKYFAVVVCREEVCVGVNVLLVETAAVGIVTAAAGVENCCC